MGIDVDLEGGADDCDYGGSCYRQARHGCGCRCHRLEQYVHAQTALLLLEVVVAAVILLLASVTIQVSCVVFMHKAFACVHCLHYLYFDCCWF